MATSQDLVPTGQEYGKRQETVAAMQQAGIPLASPQGGGAPAPTQPSVTAGGPPLEPGAPLSPLDLLEQNTPDAFPFISDLGTAPALPASDQASAVAAMSASAQSSFARAVLSRLSRR